MKKSVAILSLVLLFSFSFSAMASSLEHELAFASGYHNYLKSNYLKRADEQFDTDQMNGPGFELNYRLLITDHVGFLTGLYYNYAYREFHENSGELRVKYETFGAAFGPIFSFPIISRLTVYTGAGADIAQHTSTLEMDSSGDNITAGNEQRTGLGVHARLGFSFNIWQGLSVFLEDRHAYIPVLDYAGSGETFDIGGNYFQCGVSYLF